MLFNSYDFIFLFLIPVLLLFWSLRDHHNALYLLIIVSIIFYAQWNLFHLQILLGSIIINYIFANITKKRYFASKKKLLLIIILIINLIPLIYYKYSYFFNMVDTPLILPLAISFFTFQQIAFQVDLYYKKVDLHSFKEYLFFVLFFPQLVAGPIVHYNDILPQILKNEWKKYKSSYLQAGIFLFSLGLFKKVLLADSFAPYANHAFENILSSSISNLEAWTTLFAYSFQIYFDFSGYSDMAIGLALLFGILLPVNFYSPYKSRNISVFWKNWNITLSRFLRDYIYIPLGGNRVKIYRQLLNLLITMTIGGLWHGAGWGFLLWGVLHGVALAIVHLFQFRLPKIISVFITFLTVSLLWVLFRAPTIENALIYYKKLFTFQNFILEYPSIELIILFLSSIIIIWFMKNSMELINYHNKKIKITKWHMLLSGVLFFMALKTMAVTPAHNFVYFNF